MPFGKDIFSVHVRESAHRKSAQAFGPPSHLLLDGTEMLPLSPHPLYLLRISGAGALVHNLDEQHRQLLRLLGRSSEGIILLGCCDLPCRDPHATLGPR